MASSDQYENDFPHWQLPDVVVKDEYSDLYGHQDIQIAEKDSLPSVTEVENIRSEAEKEGVAQGKEQGYEAGYQQGYQDGMIKGKEDGFNEGKQEGIHSVKEQINTLEQLIRQLQQPLKIVDEEIEKELLSLVVELVKTSVSQELLLHPNHILSVLKTGLTLLPTNNKNMSIYLHPKDATLVNDAYKQTQYISKDWDLNEDIAITQGGCILKSNDSTLDLTIEHQLNEVLSQTYQQIANLGSLKQWQSDVQVIEEADVKEENTSAEQNDMAEPVESKIVNRSNNDDVLTDKCDSDDPSSTTTSQ